MYTGSQFRWHDNSNIIKPTTVNMLDQDRPLFIMAFSTNKGTEKLTPIYGDNYKLMYGDNEFSAHGQPAIEAQQIIDAGGAILMKRLVADDAALANLILVQKIRNDEHDKVDDNGNPLYIDQESGAETTDPSSGVRAIESITTIKWEVSSVVDAKTAHDVKLEASTIFDEIGKDGWYSFPMFIICDNGRGESIKRVKIEPNYNLSRNLDFMIYSIQEWEGSDKLESKSFSADPNVVYDNANKSLSPNTMIQLNCDIIDGVAEAAIRKLSELSGYTVEELKQHDFLYGRTRRDVALVNIVVDDSSINLAYANGLPLQNGSNGAFGSKPFGTEEWSQQAIKFWNGEFDDDIWDTDKYMIDIIPDANYPAEVKSAIEYYADNMKNAFYFRDLGLGLTSFEQILEADRERLKSTFCASYCTTYDIIDPQSKKQINVSMMYDLAPILVSHYVNGRYRPIAGELYNVVLTNAIEGTINFSPKVKPNCNQKTQMEEARINYAKYVGGKMVVESLYTSQEAYTQLSYINNVISIQEVTKALREYSNKLRFQRSEANDFSKLKEYLDPVVSKYRPNFKQLEFVYTQDTEMANQKIFNASLAFICENFEQSELFDVFVNIEYNI